MPTAHIGIGSNVGDRAAHIEAARAALAQLPNTELTAFSPVYETEPVGPVEQGAFLNAAAELQTGLPPDELLAHLLRVERESGRQRTERMGPRCLDLDLLLYGDRQIDTPELAVPHPHLHERWFVLKPLADIAPEAEHPTKGRTVSQLLAQLDR